MVIQRVSRAEYRSREVEMMVDEVVTTVQRTMPADDLQGVTYTKDAICRESMSGSTMS